MIHSDPVKLWSLTWNLFCLFNFAIFLYFHLFTSFRALMWQCKDCSTSVSSRSLLLKHYRLDHDHYGRSFSLPCTFTDCPYRFKTWNALKSHLSRSHSNHTVQKPYEFVVYNCHVCSFNEYIAHLHNHETVICFKGWSFKTNVYAMFNRWIRWCWRWFWCWCVCKCQRIWQQLLSWSWLLVCCSWKIVTSEQWAHTHTPSSVCAHCSFMADSMNLE